ncbi:MAG: hypothetical protein ACRCX4_13275 [Bacteroidales bacterium]
MKKYNKYILYVLFVLILNTMNGCSSKDDFEGNSTNNEEPIEIEVNTRSIIGTVIDGVTISNMRMIIADSPSGIIQQNLTSADGSLQSLPNNNFIIKVKPGTYTVSFIANEATALTSQLNACRFISDVLNLNIDETIYSTYTESNITLFSKDNITVRATQTPGTGEVMTDNQGWGTYFIASLQRTMAKVSLNITNASGATVKVTQIWLMNRANHYHFGGQHYSTLDYSNYQYSLINAPITIGTTPNYLISNKLIPENILAPENNIIDNATYLLIGTTYNGLISVYTVPLGTVNSSNVYTDYSTLRGKHYIISGTITRPGELQEDFTLNVLPWNLINSNIGFDQVINFSGSWAGGTSINQGNIYVYYNEDATFQFTLNEPPGAIWSASLSNGQDFKFDYTDNAVSQGITNPGYVYKIKVTPRQLQTAPGIKTDLFITVGGEEIDINGLNAGTRYSIYQIPQ